MLDIIVDEQNGFVLPDAKTYEYCENIVLKYCKPELTGTFILGSELMITAIRAAMLEHSMDHTQVQFRNINRMNTVVKVCSGYSPTSFCFIADTNCSLLMKLF